jgi:hypothetical protein
MSIPQQVAAGILFLVLEERPRRLTLRTEIRVTALGPVAAAQMVRAVAVVLPPLVVMEPLDL